MLLQFGNKIFIDGTQWLNSYSIQFYTLLNVDEYDNGFLRAFCFSNKLDTVTYMLFFESIRSSIEIIKPSVFMLDEQVFYNAWNTVSLTLKQLLCTWYVLKNCSKNLFKNKILGQECFGFQDIKSLSYRN